MNVPKLRFKEFKNDWSPKNLSEVVAFSKGNLLSKSDLDEQGSYPCILYGELYTKYHEVIRKVFSKTNYISDNIVKSKYGDILIPASGETPIDISTSSCILLDNVLLGGDINILSPKNCDGRFISYMISNNKRKTIARVAQGHSIVHLYSENLKKVNLDIPLLSEQKKIADMLELLDKKIELQTKKIEALKLFKKGLNQRMFSKIGKMKSISQYVEEYINKTIVNNQYPILSSTFNGIVIQNEYFNKQAASSKNIGYKIVPRNYITYRSMSDTGEFHFNIQDKVDIGIVSPAYPVFRINNINANYFLNYINESYDFKMQIISIKEGGTRYALGFNKFKKLKIKIIDDDEFYGDFIKKLNEYLLLEDKKLDDLNKLKKGLLQNMFV